MNISKLLLKGLVSISLISLLCHCASAPPKKKPSQRWAEAARTGDISQIEKIALEQNMNFDHRDGNGVSALMIASRFGQVDMIQFLLNQGVPVHQTDHDKQTPLEYSLLGNLDHRKKQTVVSLLIKNGADPFHRNNFGLMPIYEMVTEGYLDEIKSLNFSEKSPCDKLSSSTPQDSIVELARVNGHRELKNYLISLGCK